MHHTNRATRQQQFKLKGIASRCDSYQFFNLLTSDILFDKVDALLPAHRERQFPPTETLSMFLSQVLSADRSCQNVVNQAAISRLQGGLGVISTHTGGYCQARKRLPTDLVCSLTRAVADTVRSHSPSRWDWYGRRVKLVDGTSITMPDTAENQAVYPQQGNQKPGLGFPICRLVGVTCLSTGMLVDASIGPFNGKGGNERCLLRLLEHTFEAGDVVLGDAFFPNYFFMAKMQARGVDVLMQQNGSRARITDFRRGEKLGTKDHLIVIEKPKVCPNWMSREAFMAAPERLTVREVYSKGKVLVSTLTCSKKYPKTSLQDLYQSRWNIELDIRHIKTTLEMNTLSCKTPEMAVKEIWVYLLAYNLIRLLMVQSASLAGVLPRTLSFKHCLQLWLHVLSVQLTIDENRLKILCGLMAQQRVGKRSGRAEPRAVKRRPKPIPLLMEPRHILQERIRMHGHPRRG